MYIRKDGPSEKKGDKKHLILNIRCSVPYILYMSHSQMLGKVESGGGPIFKVVVAC